VPIQSVTNPQGHSFDLVFKKASCKGVGAWHKFAAGFQSILGAFAYALSKCGAHLGWLFEPFGDKEDRAFAEKPSHLSFYKLILDKIIDKSREK